MNYDKLAVVRALTGDEDQRNVQFKMFVDRGIDKTFFIEGAEYFTYAMDFRAKYGSYPSLDTFKVYFSLAANIAVPESLSFYIDELCKIKRSSVVRDGLVRSTRLFEEKDLIGAAEVMAATAKNVLTLGDATSDLLIKSSTQERWDKYQHRIDNPGPDGILSGFPKLDHATYGWQSDEFDMLVARTGQMKTWTLCWMVKAAMEQGKRVLLGTIEMGVYQIARRLDAMLTGTCFENIRSGVFSGQDQIDLFKDSLFALADSGGEIAIIGGAGYDVNYLRTKIDQYSPDIVYIDGFYLMRDSLGASQHWEKMLNISGDLKGIAKEFKLPIVATTQLTSKKNQAKGSTGAEDESDIMYAQAMAQNADNVIALGRIYDDSIEEFTDKLWMKFIKLRESEPIKFVIEYDFINMVVSEAENALDKREKGTNIPGDEEGNEGKENDMAW